MEEHYYCWNITQIVTTQILGCLWNWQQLVQVFDRIKIKKMLVSQTYFSNYNGTCRFLHKSFYYWLSNISGVPEELKVTNLRLNSSWDFCQRHSGWPQMWLSWKPTYILSQTISKYICKVASVIFQAVTNWCFRSLYRSLLSGSTCILLETNYSHPLGHCLFECAQPLLPVGGSMGFDQNLNHTRILFCSSWLSVSCVGLTASLSLSD